MQRVSLVTTVLNDKDGIERFFREMACQTMQPDEIVIVDAGSTDGTWELLQLRAGDTRVKAIQEKRCNVARGRNLAIAAASNELIVSTDIGCAWEPQWLEELATPLLRDEDCEAVMGSWIVRCEDLRSDWAKVEFAILDTPKMLATSRSHSSSRAIAYRKSLWRTIGGYPEDLTFSGDDLVYALLLQKATEHVAAAPVPRCTWDRHDSFRSYCKEARRYMKGIGEAGFGLKHGVLVGARLLWELLLPLAGLALLLAGVWAGALVAGLGLISVALRILRLMPAIHRANELHVRNAFWRVLCFEYCTKAWGIIGFWEGFFRGFGVSRHCRKRLRAAKISWA